VPNNPTSRDYNKASVLEVVLSRAPLTRNKLIALTGLSKATVSRAVEDLRADGFVQDSGMDAVVGRGRRSTYLDVPGTAGHVVGVSLGAQTTSVLVSDLRGRELSSMVVPTVDDDEAVSVATWLIDRVRHTSRGAGGPLRQVVVAVPGRVRDGVEVFAPAESRRIFAGTELHRAIEGLVDAPVLLDGDANASLLAIITEDATIRTAALFNLSTLLNFASCTDHKIAHGRTPTFGDVGVLDSGVDDTDLDELLSGEGLLRFARHKGINLARVDNLWAEPVDEASLAEVIPSFTTALVTAVSVVAVTLDPESVYFVGRLSPLVHRVLPDVQRRVAERLPTVPRLSVVAQELGLSVARGAAYAGLAKAHGRLQNAVLEARRQAPQRLGPAF
jgi:predicted NBD/HSP70 family sugar kinase